MPNYGELYSYTNCDDWIESSVQIWINNEEKKEMHHPKVIN